MVVLPSVRSIYDHYDLSAHFGSLLTTWVMWKMLCGGDRYPLEFYSCVDGCDDGTGVVVWVEHLCSGEESELTDIVNCPDWEKMDTCCS
jgi:hypothetical protein